jgi:hypothetical protein
LKKNFSSYDLQLSGLFNKRGKFIFYYHRIIIPYFVNNKITYLRARIIPSDANSSIRAKYLGLAGISAKRVYNVDIIKALKDGDELLITEGEMDLVKSVQNLNSNAIGIPGTNNIPFDELRKLKIDKYDITLAFDNDQAGILATQKFVDELNIKVKVMKFENGNDLTEVLS